MPKGESDMLEKEFEAYQSYDWGVDPAVLKPVDEAIAASHGDAAVRRQLETRIAAVLGSEAPRAAKDHACRQLRSIGTEASVPALAALLRDGELSHMARYALERIPHPAAGKALRDALAKTRGELKIGLVSSLGVRGEEASVAALAGMLGDADEALARAAALALGTIASAGAGRALSSAKPRPGTREAIADGLLRCAEQLLAAGRKSDARAVYERLLEDDPSDPVRGAAGLGLERCSG
jgi:HEAT repeat protein